MEGRKALRPYDALVLNMSGDFLLEIESPFPAALSQPKRVFEDRLGQRYRIWLIVS